MLLKSPEVELAPVEDRGIILGIFLGPGRRHARLHRQVRRQLEGIYSPRPPTSKRYFVVSGNPTNSGHLFIGLTDWKVRTCNTLGCPGTVLKFAGHSRRARLPITPPSLGQAARTADQLVIVTSASYPGVAGTDRQAAGGGGEEPGITNVDTDLKLNKPELSVSINRDKASDTGVRSRP